MVAMEKFEEEVWSQVQKNEKFFRKETEGR